MRNRREEDDKQKVFNDAIRKLLKKYNVNIQNCRMQIVNNIESDVTNLHSFFVDDLEKAKQIRSVNGPPGTGKTTLLKDIFAELVVEQAFDIANLPQKVIRGNVNTTYYENVSIGEIPSLITEKGIVVASSNNSALHNIVSYEL